MAKSKTTKKVRQPKAKGASKAKKPKKVTPEVEPDVEPEAEPKKASKSVSEPKVVKEPKVVIEPRALVTLTGCASLMRHGRSYEKGRTFPVNGQKLIDYYKSDPRFEVLEQK